MTYLKVVVYDPLNFPGYKEHFFQTVVLDCDWLGEFKKANPEPPRGMAWDKAQRATHAVWKQSFVDWLKQQECIHPLNFTIL